MHCMEYLEENLDEWLGEELEVCLLLRALKEIVCSTCSA